MSKQTKQQQTNELKMYLRKQNNSDPLRWFIFHSKEKTPDNIL